MIAAVTTWFSGAFTKVYGYILLAGLIVSVFVATYLKGRNDSTTANRIRVLEQDLNNRRTADEVRTDVAVTPDLAERLRRWQRPGG